MPAASPTGPGWIAVGAALIAIVVAIVTVRLTFGRRPDQESRRER